MVDSHRKAMVSLFEGSSKKKKRPSVIAMIGTKRVAELTRDLLQECLNQMAGRGDSFSAVKRARTYITAALEFALDEQLIARNPGKKLELPSKQLRKPCGRFLSLEEVRRLLSAAAAVSFLERPADTRAIRPAPSTISNRESYGSTKPSRKPRRARRVLGKRKSTTSNGYVALSPELEKDLWMWLQIRRTDITGP